MLNHLLDRIHSREISAEQLGLLADWLDSQPEVPEGKWFKRFPQMIACGEGELVKTFLTANQVPNGAEQRPLQSHKSNNIVTVLRTREHQTACDPLV